MLPFYAPQPPVCTLHFHQYSGASHPAAPMAKPSNGGCLEGLVFAFNAYSSFKNANIKEEIIRSGGDISSNVTKKVDFLLCTSPLRDSSKVKLASRYGICLVREDWAVDCIKANSKLPHKAYILQPTLSADGGDGMSAEFGSDGELISDGDDETPPTINNGDDEEVDEDGDQSSDEDVHWCFEDEYGKWVEFERPASNAIEGAYKARLLEVKIDLHRFVDLKYMLLRHFAQPKRSNRLKRTCFGAHVNPTAVVNPPPVAVQTPKLSASQASSVSPTSQATAYGTPKRSSPGAPADPAFGSKKQKLDGEPGKAKWYWQERSPYGSKWVEYEPTLCSLLEEAFTHNQECLRLDSRTYIDIKHMEQCLIDTTVHKCAVKREPRETRELRESREIINHSLPAYLPHAFALGASAPAFKTFPLPPTTPMLTYPVLLSAQLPATSRSFYQSIFPFQQNMAALKPLKEDLFVPGAHDKPSPIRMNTYKNLGISFYELLKDRTFNEYSVLIGNFIGYAFFTKYAEEVLKARGFNVITVTDEAEFILNLPKSNVAWILSGNPRSAPKENHRVPWLNTTKQRFADACLEYHKCGGGLFVWADNEPLFEQANTILPAIMKIELTGESPANQKLSLGNSGTRGQFGRHMITSGISRDLFEGVSLCFPKDGDCGLMKVLATSTDDHPCILYSDIQRDCFAGRVVVDCGWTKLANYWENAGNARYIFNATVWLLALDEPTSTLFKKRLCVSN